MVGFDKVFQLSLIELFNVQFPHDVSLSKNFSILAGNLSNFLAFIDVYLNFFILLDYASERYLDGLLHDQVLGATGSSSGLFLHTLIVTSDKLLDRGLLSYLLLKL